MIPNDTYWIFIFHFWFYIQPKTIFSSQFWLCTHNISFFSSHLFFSFHFILLNIASTWVFTVAFQFLPVDMKTFILFFQDFIYLIFGSFLCLLHSFGCYISFIPLDLQILCLLSLNDMDASCKMLNHVWSVHTDLPYRILWQRYAIPCSFVFYDSVTCHKSFIHISLYIRSQCSLNFFTWFSF